MLLPEFIKKINDPSIRTVMLCGCGGGFDFVHGMILYPELMRLGKQVIIGSYSFGRPGAIIGETDIFFSRSSVLAKRVTAKSQPRSTYGPEVHLCAFLDQYYPEQAPHSIYAYYARDFTVPLLTELYEQFIDTHAIDAIILIDGGSDSLMVGDEEGLGDPIEDAVSVTTVAGLCSLKLKLLITIGFGADRFNHVSDAASLRAIAELTRCGGFWGSLSMTPENGGFQFYKSSLDHIYLGHGPGGFRSVIASTIVAATEGWFGCDQVPPLLQKRVKPGDLYFWPLMAMLWAFDVETVAKRSLIADWIGECKTIGDCHAALYNSRINLGDALRPIENLPRHEDMRFEG